MLERRSFLSGLGTAFAAALFGQTLDGGTINAAAESWQWGPGAAVGTMPSVITAAELITRLQNLMRREMYHTGVVTTGTSWQTSSASRSAGDPYTLGGIIRITPEMYGRSLDELQDTLLLQAARDMCLGSKQFCGAWQIYTDIAFDTESPLEASAGGRMSPLAGSGRALVTSRDAQLHRIISHAGGPILHAAQKTDGSDNVIFEITSIVQADIGKDHISDFNLDCLRRTYRLGEGRALGLIGDGQENDIMPRTWDGKSLASYRPTVATPGDLAALIDHARALDQELCGVEPGGDYRERTISTDEYQQLFYRSTNPADMRRA